ncbi:MAG TPA: cadherin-like beta sandwich domain-containing protein, partial [Acholeplasma sp.]|nr:cadherin-like beta sandwich domain-containing protein [Acholeplasma sp.]
PFVITIEIEMINSSVEIEEILVDNKDIYEEGKTNYILDAVSSDINEIELIVNPKDNNADVVITVEGKVITDGLIKLVPGQNEVIVTITSEDGTNVEEYTITIEQLLETYDLLDELIIKTNKETYLLGLEDKNPEVMFNAETFTYSITVNETVEFIKMNYVLGSQKQTIIGDFDVELNINHGLNTYIVEVYPEDPTLEGNIYKIEITKVYENIDLESLLVDGEDIYIENKTSYELDNLTTDTMSIIVIPTLTNEYGTYEIKDTNGNIITNNEVPVYFGNNEITITLTSEDGSVTKEYTINVEQVLSNNNEVIDLEVIDLSNNVNKIIFDKNTLTYDVKFNYSSENARIRITTNDKAKVYINELYKANAREDFTLIPGESRLITVYIEAEDGTKGEIYKVNIYRITEDEGRMSDNNKLRDLKLEIPLDEIPFDFEQNKLEYVITVPYSASEIYLKGYPEHHGATVHNEGAYRLEVGTNDPIYIRVQAEDGTPSRIQYKVTIIREEPNTDTSLKDLVVKDLNGNILEFDNNVKFDSDNRIYTITLDKESYINQVRIEAELNNPTQKVFGNGILSLHGEIEGQYNTVLPVTVVAEDGSSEDYIIYILHDLDFSNITEIKDISIIGDDRISYFGLEFEGDVYNYDVYVPFNVLETRLIVQTLGNVIYLDSKDMEIEDNRLQQFSSNNLIIYRFKIQSMNEQNESQIYEIKVNREVADSNALLDTILIDGKEILGFDPNLNNYLYIQYILDPNKVDILAKPQSETSLVSGNRTYTLTEGESTFISITVTAQDKTTNTYIVEVKYVNSNALLGELSVYELDEFGNEFQIPIELKPGEFNYTVQIDRNINLINIKGSGEDQGGARLRGFGQYRIGDTDLVIPITVTSGDGTEERTYLVTITKSMRGDASLETVLINDGNGNIVYDFTAPYKVSNDSNIITLSAKPKDGNARVYFNDEYSSNGQFNINDLNPGQTSILIRVESEDGQTVKTYVVNLTKDYQPDLLLTILLITSLLLWIITILVLIIRKNRKEKVDQNQLIF